MAGLGRMGLVTVLLLGASLCGVAQTAPPATTDAALAEMAGEAGVIFAGTVVAIERQDAQGYVDVRFSVDQAVLGCRNGGTYALREWAGLWRGVPPFRLGQRLLVMLRDKSEGGLSSPVAGGAGVMPILGGGAPATPKTPDDASVSTAPQVDLRWVGTRVGRTAAPAPISSSGVKSQLVQGPVVRFAESGGPALSSVLSLLQWAVNHGRR